MNRSIAIIIIVLTAGILYANSLHNSFHFDDIPNIVQGEAMRSLDGNILKNIRWGHPTRLIGYYSFALNYHFNQLEVEGYHIVNILIHAMNGVLVFFLIQLLLAQRKTMQQELLFIPLFTALLFISHPVQTQAVTYIFQRMASLATLFYLLSICCYLKGRVRDFDARAGVWFGISLVSAVLGMMTKQITMTIPLAIGLIEFIFLRSEGKSKRSFLPLICVGAVFLFIPALYKFNVMGMLRMSSYSESHVGEFVNSWNYFLTQFRVIPNYLRLWVAPYSQNLDYDFPLSYSLTDVRVLLGMVAAMIWTGFAIRIRSTIPLVSLGMLWFAVALLVESSVIPIQNVIFEHRMYLPSVGLAMATIGILNHWLRSEKHRTVVCVCIVLVLSVLTIQRNKVWRNDFTLWTDVTRKSPQKPRGYINLGMVYFEQEDMKTAESYFDTALKFDPENYKAFKNRGNARNRMQRYDEALKDFDRAIELKPNSYESWNHRGAVYLAQKKYDLALKNFDQAVIIKGDYELAYGNRAAVHIIQGRYDDAMPDLTKAIELNPDYVDGYNNRGLVYLERKQWSQALADFNQAIVLNPKIAYMYNNRADAYLAQKKFAQALKDVTTAKTMGHPVPPAKIKKLQQLLN